MSDQRAESIADQVGQLKAEIERLKAEAEGNYKAAKYAQGRVDELLQTNATLETALKEEKAVADARKTMADNGARRAEGLELQVESFRKVLEVIAAKTAKDFAFHGAYALADVVNIAKAALKVSGKRVEDPYIAYAPNKDYPGKPVTEKRVGLCLHCGTRLDGERDQMDCDTCR